MTAAASIYRFHHGAEQVAAVVVAYCERRGGSRRLFLRDTAERMWMAEMAGDGVQIIDGPISVDQAMVAAQQVAAGVDHGPVSRTMMTMALGMIGLALAGEETP